MQAPTGSIWRASSALRNIMPHPSERPHLPPRRYAIDNTPASGATGKPTAAPGLAMAACGEGLRMLPLLEAEEPKRTAFLYQRLCVRQPSSGIRGTHGPLCYPVLSYAPRHSCTRITLGKAWDWE